LRRKLGQAGRVCIPGPGNMATVSIGIDGLEAPQTYPLHFGVFKSGSLKISVTLVMDSLVYISTQEVGHPLEEIRCIKSETNLQNGDFQTQVNP
jgi:hypothetical protein